MNKLTAKQKRELEDKSIVTNDVHELVKREVYCQHKAFMIAYFMGEERSAKNQKDIRETLNRVVPSRTLTMTGKLINAIAIFVLYMIMIFGCTG